MTGYAFPHYHRGYYFRGFHICVNGKNKINLDGNELTGTWVEGFQVPGFYEGTWYIGDPRMINNNVVVRFARGSGKPALRYHTILTLYGFREVCPQTICQFTGEYYNNGKRIYEHDICISINTPGTKVVVLYDKQGKTFVCKDLKRNKGIRLSDSHIPGLIKTSTLFDDIEMAAILNYFREKERN